MIKDKLPKFKIIYVPIILMLLCATLLIGITDYITAGFSTDTLKTSKFWIDLAVTNGSTICIIISILLIKIDSFVSTDPEYLTQMDFIRTFKHDVSYQPYLFLKFAADENKKEKIETYKDKINKKFSKLKPKPKDLEIQKYGTKEQKESNKYCIKNKYYTTLLSDEYINENISKMHIKHNTITERLVFCGVSTQSGKRDYITKHKFNKVFIDLLPKYLLTFSFTVVLASVVPDLQDGITAALLFKTAIRLFTVCSQIIYALNYSNRYNTEVTMNDINFRCSVIEKYKLWLHNQIKQTEVKEEVNNG